MNIKEKMFDLWVDKNYPNFYFVMGIINILVISCFVVSIVLPFLSIQWWWKLLVFSVGCHVVTIIIQRICINYFIEKFTIKKRKM